MFDTSAAGIDFKEDFDHNAKQELETGCLTFDTFLVLQRLWSAQTFGPNHIRGPLGPLRHLAKEVDEAIGAANVFCEGVKYAQSLVMESPTKFEKDQQTIANAHAIAKNGLLEEYADLFFLVVDAVWRSGFTPTELRQALTRKYLKNKGRDWGNWRTKDPNSAIEHNREGEQP